MTSLTTFYTVYQNVFVLYSPMMATNVAVCIVTMYVELMDCLLVSFNCKHYRDGSP